MDHTLAELWTLSAELGDWRAQEPAQRAENAKRGRDSTRGQTARQATLQRRAQRAMKQGESVTRSGRRRAQVEQ